MSEPWNICENSPDEFFRLLFFVEVLSDSTRRADFTEKKDANLTVDSLQVLIFVEPDEARVLLYRRSLPRVDSPQRSLLDWRW